MLPYMDAVVIRTDDGEMDHKRYFKPTQLLLQPSSKPKAKCCLIKRLYGLSSTKFYHISTKTAYRILS